MELFIPSGPHAPMSARDLMTSEIFFLLSMNSSIAVAASSGIFDLRKKGESGFASWKFCGGVAQLF
jgi:hypothetical protein